MRKSLGVFVLLALVGAGYFVGVTPTAGHSGHTVFPSPASVALTEGNAGTKDVDVTVRVTRPPEIGETIAFDFGCADGSGPAGATDGGAAPDYACDPNTPASPNIITFTNANSQRTFTAATINGDTTSELNETFTILLFNARCTSNPNVGAACGLTSSDPGDITVTITNDDQAPGTVSINDASAPEANNNGQPSDVNFTVTLSRPCASAQGNMLVDFTTQSGTAGDGIDYVGAAGTLTFAPGQTSKPIVVKTIVDNIGEPNETFSLLLSFPPQGANTCANGFSQAEPPTGTSRLKATGTITDDDGPPGAAVRAACSGNASGDFNGDGRDDLAVGIPGQAVSANGNAGAVQVLYGNAGAVQVLYGSLGAGLVDTGKQLFTQGAGGVDGDAESGDEFGSCLAAGNFNGDAFSDLAIGVSSEDISSTRGSFNGAGAVNVIYGSSSGLNAAATPADQIWAQDSPGVLGGSEVNDAFGAALASGDFNNDGRDDLAIGVPGEDIGNKRDAGAVNVLPGSANGLSATGDSIWFQDKKKVAGASETDDVFGAALATGDLDGDGTEDLVIGVPGEAIGATARAGAVHVIRSAAGGLSRTLDKLWFQGNSGVQDTAEANDRLGAAVAVGDFDNDGFADIAAGAPFEDLGTRTDVGGVVVLYSTNAGPGATDNELWSENDSSKTTSTTATAGDLFGAALSAGDLNNDGLDDLAIGVPLSDAAGPPNAGAVDVLYGAAAGLATPQRLTQTGADSAEPDDAFGSALATGDYTGDDRADLAVGVPKDDVGTATDAGVVSVYFGSATTLSTAADQSITQDSGPTIQASGSQSGDQYGGSVG